MNRKRYNFILLIPLCVLFKLTQTTCLNKIILSITQGNQYNMFLNKPENYTPKNLTHFSIDSDQLENFLTKLDFKLSLYIIFLNKNHDLNNTLAAIMASAETYSSYAQFLILTKNQDGVQEIAKILWRYKLLRSFIVLHQMTLSVFKIRLSNCEEAEAEKMNFEEDSCDFEGVIVNLKEIMKGCPLYVITGVQPPIVNPENSTLKGVLLEMMDAFGEASDRAIVYRPYDPIYMDEIVTSYTFEAIIESFQSGYADVFLGAIQISCIEVMDIGPLVTSNDLIFIAPRELISDAMDLLFNPENVRFVGTCNVIGVFVVLLFHFLIRWTIGKNLFGGVGKTLLMVFGITLNVTMDFKVPKHPVVRGCLMCIFIFAMGFSSYLQGTLISILNGPTYEPPISDLKGLLDKGTPIMLTTPLAIFFQFLDLPYFHAVYEKHILMEEGDLYESVNALLVKRDFATVAYRDYLMMKPNLEKSFSIFDLYPNAHAPGMQKNYFMHREFFNWFEQMIEFGIIEKFWRLYEFYYALENFVQPMSRIYRVSLEQFLPVLVLWGSGCGLAVFCFILEILVSYLSRSFG